jgi:hypothetical protein
MRYQRLIIYFSVLLVSFATALTMPAADEILNNASVIELQSLNLGDAVIIEKIKTSQCNFDTSLAGLKQLKAANLSTPVIQAMVAAKTPGVATGDPNNPAAPHTAGVWVLQETNGQKRMTQLESEIPAETSHGGYIGPWGSGKISTTVRLTGTQSELQLSQRRPEFYLYIWNGQGANQGGSPDFAGVENPKEIVLAQFIVIQKDAKRNANQRALDTGAMGAYGGSTGIDRKAVREFDSEKVADGIYKVTPQNDLPDGEYTFCPAISRGYGRLFTFGVQGK